MASTSLLFLRFLVLLLFSALLYYKALTTTLDYTPGFTSNRPASCKVLQPLKVYIYPLDIKFNIGMFKIGSYYYNFNGFPETLPPWPDHFGTVRQHSVEYWLLASLLYDSNSDTRNERGDDHQEAVRVLDPELADIFYVPFFSSLSHALRHGNGSFGTLDDVLQEEVVKLLRKWKYWKRSGGRDHVIAVHHPNAFGRERDKLKESIFIVNDFGNRSLASFNLRKDVVSPFPHFVKSFVEEDQRNHPYESRKTLLFFRGRTHRKSDGEDRDILKDMLSREKDVVFQVTETDEVLDQGIKASTKGMRSSKFCLSPAGDTPSSGRLFDAIVSHCVPVIVSDKVELPFEDEIDYTQFSVFFSQEEAKREGYLVNQLRNITKTTWLQLWNSLKNFSHHFEFQYPPKEGDAANMIWKQVKKKVPEIKLAVNRSKRLKLHD